MKLFQNRHRHKKPMNNTVANDFLVSPSQKTGHLKEKLALQYLTTQGLVLLESNYRTKTGEIDLIMKHNNHLVFVEVRYRRSSAYGGSEESITLQKQKKLIRTAQYYLSQHRCHDQYACRFDVISLNHSEINWIPNAFTC